MYCTFGPISKIAEHVNFFRRLLSHLNIFEFKIILKSCLVLYIYIYIEGIQGICIFHEDIYAIIWFFGFFNYLDFNNSMSYDNCI